MDKNFNEEFNKELAELEEMDVFHEKIYKSSYITLMILSFCYSSLLLGIKLTTGNQFDFNFFLIADVLCIVSLLQLPKSIIKETEYLKAFLSGIISSLIFIVVAAFACF